MNKKELKETATQVEGAVVDDDIVINNARLVTYNGKKYAVSLNAILTINVTAKCNAHCFFCYNGLTFMRDYDYVDCHASEFLRAAEFAIKAGITVATITGGEPTLNPSGLFQIIQCLKKMGFATIRMHTNGCLLTNDIVVGEEVKPMWKWLEIYGVNELTLSIADYRSENNRAIMGIDNLLKVQSFLLHAKETMMKVRLSCFICSKGVMTPVDIEKYFQFAIENNVNNVIFRIKPTAPEKDSDYVKEISRIFIALGWSVTYQHKKTDSIVYVMEKDNKTVSLSCAKEEIDPDKKIRRLVYMPDNVLYTSWLDPSSFLFDDDAERIVRSAMNTNDSMGVGNYPGRIWNKPIPSYVHQHESHKIDLHVHSMVSDGLLTPLQVIHVAEKAGIQQMVFTEHNCLHDSVDKVIEIAREHRINIPLIGVEFSTVYCLNNKPWMKFHLLVYGKKKEQFGFIDNIYNPNSPRNEYLIGLHRRLICEGIIHKSIEEIYRIDDADAPTRKKMLVRTPLSECIAKSVGITVEEAKDKYLPQMDEKDRYKDYLDIENLIDLAHENGCVTVLAHPGWIRSYDRAIELSENDLFLAIANLARSGLDGLEIVHRLNSEEIRDKLYYLATELGLIVTGGSDYHGKARCVFGEHGTSEDELKRILERFR